MVDSDLDVGQGSRPGPSVVRGDGNGNVGLGLGKVKGSAIWDHFTKNDLNKSKCNYCFREFSTKYGTTTSLCKHLESKHTVQYANFVKEKNKRLVNKEATQPTPTIRSVGTTARPLQQQTIMNAFQNQVKLPHNHPVARKITRKIAEWIATDLQPFSVVEENGFVRLMQEARPDYNIPSRTTFSRILIPGLYAETKINIQKQLTDCASKARSMSFTSDIWTSRANISYISLTCHFMNEEFDINSFCLGNAHFPGAHTAEAIFKKITTIMDEWDDIQGFHSRMPVFFVTDNAKNYVAAVRDNWKAMSCFAHTLQLAIGDAKKSNEPDVIKKVRSVVTHYNHSPKAYSRLQEFQIQMNLPVNTLPQDVPTRWNSEHAMLKRVYEQKNAIAAELGSCNNRGTAELLSGAEWQVVDGLIKVLEPFAEATAISSGDTYPTRSMVIPLIYQLRGGLSSFIRNNANQGHGIGYARNLERSLLARFPLFSSNSVDCMSMMLDPRFKDRVFDTATLKNNARMKLEKEVDQTNIYETKSTAQNQQQHDDNQQPHSSLLWAEYDKSVVQEQSGTSSSTSTRRQEVTIYLAEPVIPRISDPLTWWKHNQSRFPSLAKLAKCYLSIPATQVASERQFSAGSNTVTSRRERLTPLNVEMLVFLNQNLK